MRFSIRNFRAVTKAETEHARITMILGGNMVGKTTIINAIGAALTGDTKVYGATKANIGFTILQHGTDRASAVVSFEGGAKASIQWPGSHESLGGVPDSDAITVGRVDPCRHYDRQEWVDFIRQISGAKEVSTDKLRQALAVDMPIEEMDLDELIEVADVSWDDAMAEAVELRKLARKDWERATLDSWGANKARDWVAPGYQASTDLPAANEALRSLNDELIKVGILAEKDGTDIGIIDRNLLDHRTKLKDVRERLEDVDRDVEKAVAEADSFPTGEPLTCPHCGKASFLLNHPEPHLAEKSAKMSGSIEHNTAMRRLADMAELQAKGRARLAQLETLIKDQTERKDAILAAKEAAGDVDVDALTERRNTLVIDIMAAERTNNAQRLYKLWEFWNKAADLLAPTGLRTENIKEALADVGNKINFIQAYLFPDHDVALQEDDAGITITFDGMSYQSLTWHGDPNSYMLRIQYMFQIIQAQRLGKDVPILLDRVDTLERTHVIGLLQYLVDHNMQAVMARTSITGKPEVDKLLKQGVGRTYWLQDGILEAV